MTSRIFFALTLALILRVFAAPPPEYEPRKANAEKVYADGSFAKAHELYASVNIKPFMVV